MPQRNVVLVVDDDPEMLKSVARLLRQFGYATVLFPSAEAFANHSDFNQAVCVLLDIDLGDGSGIELRHRLKAANISVPVIYMTGNDSPAVRTAAHQSGCLAYLVKPFPAKSLIEPRHRAAAEFACGARRRERVADELPAIGHCVDCFPNGLLSKANVAPCPHLMVDETLDECIRAAVASQPPRGLI